ncbi:MAG TPA: tripartite tricarboxylate transporter substrate-binding protein [Xanthobacteraceae bacterium]
MRQPIATVAVVLACGLACAPVAAQSVAEFYSGKQITLIVGATPGGGYDMQARLVAKHLSGHLPGHPAVVVQNMPAAGSLAATNHIANVAARDGTAIALVQRGMLLIKSWNPAAVRFDLDRLSWIGSISREVGVSAAWHTAPHRNLRDLLDQELIVGGTTGIDPETTPRLLNALIGTRFNIITGYPGTTEIALAMERGEVQGIGDWSWSSLKAARPSWLAEKKLNILLQSALQREPELPDVPFALDFVKNEADRKVMELYLTQKTAARPVIAPPGLPADRVAALREAFAALAQDKEFLADAQKTGLDVSPVPGAEIDRVVALITSASTETAQRLGRAISGDK